MGGPPKIFRDFLGSLDNIVNFPIRMFELVLRKYFLASEWFIYFIQEILLSTDLHDLLSCTYKLKNC